MAWRAKIGIFQRMRIKNLRGQWGPVKKIDFFAMETSKNHLIRNFLRNGRLRVNPVMLQKNAQRTPEGSNVVSTQNCYCYY